MKVLVTGTSSYAGLQFAERVKDAGNKYHVSFLSVRDHSWRKKDFSQYDAIYHVAAIVHKKELASKEKEYYEVNSKLTYDIAVKAKKEGVKSFIFLSSIAVYGVVGEIGKKNYITKKTKENPKTLNGKSKLVAEKLLEEIGSDNFNIAILRVPIIYGENSPGNYMSLVKLSRVIPIFPHVLNERSMIHVNHLSDIVMHIVNEELKGTFLVNDPENVNTSQLYKKLRKQQGKNTYLSKIAGILILSFGKKNIKVKKIFGNMCYEIQDTKIPGFRSNEKRRNDDLNNEKK